MIIDTHAHYDDEAFDPDREVLLASMQEHGIEKLVNVCASIDGLQDTVKLIEKYPFIYGAMYGQSVSNTSCDRGAYCTTSFSFFAFLKVTTPPIPR